jgi:pyridoxal phosphate enzyme (YggS family)
LGGETLPSRLAAVREQVAAAARSVGRDPGGIGIVAVTKTLPPAAVVEALDTGLVDVGESYVQEARAKREAVAAARADPGCWHLVGGLQRNKVRVAVAVFDRVHTIDSPALVATLAAEVAASARWAGRRLPVLVQVNVGGEGTKRGVPPEGAEGLAAEVLRYPRLALEGFMTVAPLGTAGAAARPHFRLLREVRDRAAERLGVELPHLSMGMSPDFTAAVEEGATWLRLGRVLFGARGPGARRPGSSARGEAS